MLTAFMLIVIMLSVFMLIVVAPLTATMSMLSVGVIMPCYAYCIYGQCHYADCFYADCCGAIVCYHVNGVCGSKKKFLPRLFGGKIIDTLAETIDELVQHQTKELLLKGDGSVRLTSSIRLVVF